MSIDRRTFLTAGAGALLLPSFAAISDAKDRLARRNRKWNRKDSGHRVMVAIGVKK